MEQNCLYKVLYLWSVDFQQRNQGKSIKNTQSIQQIVLGRLDIHIHKSEFRPNFVKHPPKNNSQWIVDLKVRDTIKQ